VKEEYKINEMEENIRTIRTAAEQLSALGGNIEAVKKNVVRLLASTRMLELNISDAKDVL
jgi:hypothetical protein